MDEQNPYAAPQGKIEAPQNHDGAPLASLGQRLLGAIIDNLALTVIVLVVAVIFMGGFSTFAERADDLTTTVILTLVGIGAWIAINAKSIQTRGQTLGKIVVGSKIVRTDGSAVTLSHVLAKRMAPMWVLTMIPLIGGLIGLANALCVFRSSRKCLHDDIADTKVISIR